MIPYLQLLSTSLEMVKVTKKISYEKCCLKYYIFWNCYDKLSCWFFRKLTQDWPEVIDWRTAGNFCSAKANPSLVGLYCILCISRFLELWSLDDYNLYLINIWCVCIGCCLWALLKVEMGLAHKWLLILDVEMAWAKTVKYVERLQIRP